jgi:hypothetical protein
LPFLAGRKPLTFIAFPKNNSGRDVMIDAPSSIDESQLKELHIKLNCSISSVKLSENVEYQLFSKKRIFNNNHMILNITFAHYKLLLQLQCVQVQLNFSMNQRLRIHYRRRNRKRHFVHASGINAEELREGDRVSYEEEEGRKGVAAKVVAVI